MNFFHSIDRAPSPPKILAPLMKFYSRLIPGFNQ